MNKDIEQKMVALRDSLNSELINDELAEMVFHVKQDIKGNSPISQELCDDELEMVAGGIYEKHKF